MRTSTFKFLPDRNHRGGRDSGFGDNVCGDFTTQDVARIREAYAREGGPEVVRDGKAIAAAQMARVMAQFQPPNEVLVVRASP